MQRVQIPRNLPGLGQKGNYENMNKLRKRDVVGMP